MASTLSVVFALTCDLASKEAMKEKNRVAIKKSLNFITIYPLYSFFTKCKYTKKDIITLLYL